MADPQKTTNLITGIPDRSARVGIIGLGYVGLPTLVCVANAGFKVVGIEIDERRASEINAGQSYIEDVSNDTLARLRQAERISATTDYAALRDSDIILVCVPTPIDEHKEPALGALQDTIAQLGKHLRPKQLIIVQSTTFPGTTEELVLPQLEKTGLQVGKDFYLAFSPERIDPGNQQFSVENIPKVVGGVTPRCTEAAVAFLSTLVDEVTAVSSPKVAETTKLLENIFRSVNIALVNELSEACHRMDIDIWEVINAASTKPFGYMPFYPGIGVGGHCIPVDPFYLSWKAKENDFYVDFIELAAKTNDNRPYYIVSRIRDVLEEHDHLVKGSSLLLLGVSFKQNIGDARNSPALRIAELLLQRGANIAYCDPHVPKVTIGGSPFQSQDLDEALLGNSAATIILVNHSYFDMRKIVEHSKLVIDAVDATRILGPVSSVVKL